MAYSSSASRASDQQEFRCPARATVIEFTNGGRITFTGQDGVWCLGTDARGQPWRWYAMLSPAGTVFVENHAERIWPLQIGKEIEFRIQGNSSNRSGDLSDVPFWYTERIVVVRQEKVTVPAGTFDAWVIEHHEDVPRGGFSSVRTYWYAPEVGFLVKQTYHISQGVGKDDAFEAKAISSAAP